VARVSVAATSPGDPTRIVKDAWEEQAGVMADVIDAAAVAGAVRGIRERAPSG
jgi:hypothetical protein